MGQVQLGKTIPAAHIQQIIQFLITLDGKHPELKLDDE